MTKNLLLAAGSLLLCSGMFALQGCYDSGPDYYGGYGRGYSGGYYSEPYYAGGGYRDYDEHPNYWANHEAREERHEAHEAEERAEQHAAHEARAAHQAEENAERHAAHEAREARHHDND